MSEMRLAMPDLEDVSQQATIGCRAPTHADRHCHSLIIVGRSVAIDTGR
jgi:hypothetical protein